MTSKLSITAKHLPRPLSRRLVTQRNLLTSHIGDTPRSPQLLRQPSEDPTPSLTPEHEAYYGGILLRAVLQSTQNNTPIIHGHAVLSSPVEPASSGPEPSPPPAKVSDEEWEIRTGRAIYILEKTLPDFFQTGLISSLDLTTGEPSSPQKSWSLANPTDTWHTIKDKLISTTKSTEDCNEAPAIYSPRIRLAYTPPTPLPAPFPKTLHAEGLHLYIASSIFVRHTLNALYTDLAVDITRARVNNGGAAMHGRTSPDTTNSQSKKSRERSVAFGLMVTGLGRVSGIRTEWEVNCTYTFSPLTGLIIHHSVDSIEPAPHQALFEALGKFGLLDSGVGPKPGNVSS